MGFIVAVSAFIIPLIIFYVVVDGIIHQTDVYDVQNGSSRKALNVQPVI